MSHRMHKRQKHAHNFVDDEAGHSEDDSEYKEGKNLRIHVMHTEKFAAK